MIGSIMIVDFSTRKELDQWLENEAYVKNNVWQKVEINLCKVPEMFMK